MQKLILVLSLSLLLGGCGRGVFNVSKAEYTQQVKTLGVLPLMVDGRSVVGHPEKREIFALLRRASAGHSAAIVEDLRRKKGYFDVRLVQEPPRLLAEKLLVAADVDESGQPRGYRLDQQFLSELCRNSVVDGLLLVALQGAVHSDKRWSRNTFETLTTDYSDIMATASVVDADGRVLWEMGGEEAMVILRLQYPDFDEAHYNKTDAVKLKLIGLSGLEKTLLPSSPTMKESPGSPQITELVEKVAAALSPSLFR